MSQGSAMSLTWLMIGSWWMVSKNEDSLSTSCSDRASAEARSNRKPSTCISVTQYRSESIISCSAAGVRTSKVLPQPV